MVSKATVAPLLELELEPAPELEELEPELIGSPF